VGAFSKAFAVFATAVLAAACSQPDADGRAAGRGAAIVAPQGRDLLNSERIERAFGSYGIEVLKSGPRERISNLYTVERDRRVGRTFAVVRYPDDIPAELAVEHRAIVGGGSMGAVLAGAGWSVLKAHLYYGERPATSKVAGLMAVEPGTRLATHVYLLEVEKGSARLAYATLVEIHHPEYLQRADLEAIYGPVRRGAGDGEIVAAMLATTAAAEAE
jgi:hypothetical protein